MTHKEEIYARRFYKELKDEFLGKQSYIFKFLGLITKKTKSDIAITLKKAGTQSYCTIAKDARRCSIHCFDIDMMGLKYIGPEFYTTFMERGKSIANGRTFDKPEMMDAIKNWIQNKTLEELYSKFNFIDERKNQLERIRADINNLNSQLMTIFRNAVVEESLSTYSLWFINGNRSCRIYYYGYEPNPRYIFKWDDCTLFETSSSDLKRLCTLITKWVIDKAMPSTLKVEFAELNFGELAEYYEKGNGVEGGFILSWDIIENFYREINLDNKNEILQLIKEMREKGFERTLRAGQSLNTLVLSRSRRHGLREDQNSISFSFDFIKSAMEVRTRKGDKFEFDEIVYNDTIEKLLKTIELERID